jgi:hypothetical protein
MLRKGQYIQTSLCGGETKRKYLYSEQKIAENNEIAGHKREAGENQKAADNKRKWSTKESRGTKGSGRGNDKRKLIDRRS